MKKEGIEILLIQGSPEGTEQLERALRGYYANVNIYVGSTGRECLDYLREGNYDVLLLGYQLLDCTGLDVLEKIKANQEAPPVIMIVNLGELWVAVSAMKAGAVDYIAQSGEYLLTLPFVIQRTLNYHRSVKEVDRLRQFLRRARQGVAVPRGKDKPAEALGIFDRLTETYNEQYFESRVTEELQRARRYVYPISLLVIDIDNLLLYGDLRQRDQVLLGVARMVSQGVRQTDLVARRIETDFGMVLLYADIDGGRRVAERIRKQVEENAIDGEHSLGNVTVSIGISSLSLGDFHPDTFVMFADRALHDAKARGGNQIAWVDRS